jgi:hypothetical protein
MAMSVITGGQSPLQGCLNSYLTDKPSVVKAKKQEKMQGYLPSNAVLQHLRQIKPAGCLFDLDGLFEFRNGLLVPNSRNALLISASRNTGANLSSQDELLSAEKEIIRCPNLAMAIRGKYIAWFMVKQCEDLWANITETLVRFVSRPKKRVEFGHKNANVIYAPRARIPDTLCCFLDSTYRSYILSEQGMSRVSI